MTWCFYLVEGPRDDNLVFELNTIILVCSFFVLSTVAMQLEWRAGEDTRRVSSQSHLIQRIPVNIHDKPTSHCEEQKTRKAWFLI